MVLLGMGVQWGMRLRRDVLFKDQIEFDATNDNENNETKRHLKHICYSP
jgi:hypothetical protein